MSGKQIQLTTKASTKDEADGLIFNYSKLRAWMLNSLDRFRDEIWPLLWVMYAHSCLWLMTKFGIPTALKFLNFFEKDHLRIHSIEILELKKMNMKSPFVHRLEKHRFKLFMSHYSNELVVTFFEHHDMNKFLVFFNDCVEKLNPKNLNLPPPTVSSLTGLDEQLSSVSITTGMGETVLNEIQEMKAKWSVPNFMKAILGGFTGAKATLGLYPSIPKSFADKMGILDEHDREGDDALTETTQQRVAARETKLDRYNEKQQQEQRKQQLALDRSNKESSNNHTKIEPPKDSIPDTDNEYFGYLKSQLVPQVLEGSVDPAERLNESSAESAAKQFRQLKSSIGDLTLSRASGVITWPSIAFQTFFNSHDSLICVDVSLDSKIFAAGFDDSRVRIWYYPTVSQIVETPMEVDTETAQRESRVHTLKEPIGEELVGHAGPVYGCSISPNNQLVVTCSQDGTVRLWKRFFDLELPVSNKRKLDSRQGSWRNVFCFDCGGFPVWDIKFSPVGEYFVTGSQDSYVRLWSVKEKKRIGIFAGHLSDVESVAWHPNGQYIASGSADKTLRIWDIFTGECCRLFCGHFDSINAIAFTSSGRYVVSGGQDGLIIVWDFALSKRVAVLEGHSGPVFSVSISQDCLLISSGSADGSVRVWDAFDIWGNSMEDHYILEDTRIVSKVQCKSFPTKYTPVHFVKFQNERMILASGSFALPTM